MNRSWGAWLPLVAAAAGLFLLNGWSWKPGVGCAAPGRPAGTELEQFFGWPATYRAELWWSDDEKLVNRILEAAPFYDPAGEMVLRTHTLRSAALALDVTFALLVLLGLALFISAALRGRWRARDVGLLGAVGRAVHAVGGERIGEHFAVTNAGCDRPRGFSLATRRPCRAILSGPSSAPRGAQQCVVLARRGRSEAR